MKRILSAVFAVTGAVLLTAAASGCAKTANNPDDLLLMSAREAQKGQWRTALMLSRQAVLIQKDNVNALLMRSIAAEHCGEKDLALDSALQATKLSPNNFLTQYTLGRLYSTNATRQSEALEVLQKALSLKPGDRNTLILLANISLDLKSDKALSFLEALAAADPGMVNTSEYQTQLGTALARLSGKENGEKAIKAFLAAYRLKKDNAINVYNLATYIDYYNGTPQKAIPFYNQYLKLTKDNKESATYRTIVSERLSKLR